jgi:hypothetical protein
MDTLNHWVMTAASWLFVLQVIGLSIFLIWDWMFGDKRSSGHRAGRAYAASRLPVDFGRGGLTDEQYDNLRAQFDAERAGGQIRAGIGAAGKAWSGPSEEGRCHHGTPYNIPCPGPGCRYCN